MGMSVYTDPSLSQWNESGYFLDMYSFGITMLVVLCEEIEIIGIYGKAFNIYRNQDIKALNKFFKKDWDDQVIKYL